MTRKQIAILAGLGLSVLFVFCVLGYFVLGYFGISTPEPIAIPKPTATPTPTPEPVGGKPEERTRIAKHVALYDGGGGSLDELCSLQAALFVGIGGGQILPPQQGDADFYRFSETNHYWIAMSNDPSGNVWTVTCVVDFSRVTAEGVIPMSEPMLLFLYNTADGCIYPQGNELVSLLATMGYLKYGSGQPRIYAPLE
jgi:hypothetical protein